MTRCTYGRPAKARYSRSWSGSTKSSITTVKPVVAVPGGHVHRPRRAPARPVAPARRTTFPGHGMTGDRFVPTCCPVRTRADHVSCSRWAAVRKPGPDAVHGRCRAATPTSPLMGGHGPTGGLAAGANPHAPTGSSTMRPDRLSLPRPDGRLVTAQLRDCGPRRRPVQPTTMTAHTRSASATSARRSWSRHSLPPTPSAR